MKTLKGVMVLWAILIAVVVLMGAPAWAQTYIGEFCWSALKTADESGPDSEGPFILRAGVTYLGGVYYLLQGKVATPDNPFFLHATGVIVGNEIWITGSTAQDHTPTEPWRDSGVMQIRLNASTLSGTFWAIGTDFKTTDRIFDHGYAAGTVTFTACP